MKKSYVTTIILLIEKKRTQDGIIDEIIIRRRFIDDDLTIPDHLNRHLTHGKRNLKFVYTWGYCKRGR